MERLFEEHNNPAEPARASRKRKELEEIILQEIRHNRAQQGKLKRGKLKLQGKEATDDHDPSQASEPIAATEVAAPVPPGQVVPLPTPEDIPPPPPEEYHVEPRAHAEEE